MTGDIHSIEKRSLRPARWANLFMGAAGITAALASNATALMLDGLFSGVNFVAAVAAAKVSQSIQRKPDVLRPFGYEIDEAVYVMFRSLVLTGIIVMAAFNAGNKIFTYATGGEVAPVKLGWVVGYMVLMVTICFALAAWHHRNWLATGKQSELLKTERTGAVIDGVLSAAAGAAFLLIALLKHTPLAFLVPISDAIVVLGLAVYMIWQPIGMFGRALREVVGEAADDETQQKLRAALEGGLDAGPIPAARLRRDPTRPIPVCGGLHPAEPAGRRRTTGRDSRPTAGAMPHRLRRHTVADGVHLHGPQAVCPRRPHRVPAKRHRRDDGRVLVSSRGFTVTNATSDGATVPRNWTGWTGKFCRPRASGPPGTRYSQTGSLTAESRRPKRRSVVR